MQGEIEEWKDGWYGISLGLSPAEIDRFIVLLNQLRKDSGQHFHISSDQTAAAGPGDIEFYVAEPDTKHNMRLGGVALAPGSTPPAGV